MAFSLGLRHCRTPSIWLAIFFTAFVFSSIAHAETSSEAAARCEQKLGAGAVAEEELDFGEISYVCNCASPYRWNESNTRCVQETSGEPSDVKQSGPAAASLRDCDLLAANPEDPERKSPGLKLDHIKSKAAIAACTDAVSAHPDEARLHYQLGRALQAGGQAEAAIYAYRDAEKRGYTAALYSLARAYENGTGVSKNAETSGEYDLKAANNGFAASMYALGKQSFFGTDVPKNYPKALRWFRKGADAGDVYSMTMIGYAYAQGHGVIKSNDEAIRWYRKASDKGHAAATSNLAIRYFKGFGVAQDRREAMRLWRIAANNGHPDAMTSVGYLYANGFGVGKDDREALRWYRKAAEAGETLAMYNLGARYLVGSGVARSSAEARRWIKAALKSGGERLIFGLTDKNNSWSAATHKMAQRILRDANLYKGAIDGKLGPATLSAIRRYKEEK